MPVTSVQADGPVDGVGPHGIALGDVTGASTDRTQNWRFRSVSLRRLRPVPATSSAAPIRQGVCECAVRWRVRRWVTVPLYGRRLGEGLTRESVDAVGCH